MQDFQGNWKHPGITGINLISPGDPPFPRLTGKSKCIQEKRGPRSGWEATGCRRELEQGQCAFCATPRPSCAHRPPGVLGLWVRSPQRSQPVPVLAWTAITKYHSSRSLNLKDLFPHSPGAYKSKTKVWPIWFLVRGLPLAASRCLLMWPFPAQRERVCKLAGVPSHKDTNSIRTTTSFNLHYCSRGPVFKYSHTGASGSHL